MQGKGENNKIAREDEPTLQVSGSLKQTAKTTRINIASPCYRLTYSSTFVTSLVNLLTLWRDTGINYSFNLVDTSDIELSRNFLITKFYYKLKDCSHILFLDNDMGFDCKLINRMIQLNESVVGVASPKRQIDLKKFHQEAGQPYEQALAKSVEFLLRPAKIQINKPGFRQVESCGAGILLISRDCITQMIHSCPEIVDKNIEKYPPIVHQFDTFLTPFRKIESDTERYSEDISFCHRWVNQCGGKIYANVDTRIKHTGTLAIESRYEDLFYGE